MLTRIFLCILFAGSFFTLIAQPNSEQVLVDKQSLSTTITLVKGETEGGNISIEGVPGNEARLEVYAWARGSEESIRKRYAEQYALTVNTTNGTLTVSARRKKRGRDDSQVSVSLRLYVPVSVSSELHTSGGNISCRHLSAGRQKVTTSGGNISLDDVKGNVSGKTSGGNISINQCSDVLELFTSGGNVHASKSNGKLMLSTSGGNISIKELSGTVKATTSGGNVTAESIDGSLTTSSSGGNLQLEDLSCTLEASTDGGNLSAQLNKMGSYVRLRNSGSGHTQLEVPGDTRMDIHATGRSIKLPRTSAFSGDISEREIDGSVNGGGVPVTIDGGDSRVTITMR